MFGSYYNHLKSFYHSHTSSILVALRVRKVE